MNSFTKDVSELGINYAPLGMFLSCFLVTSDNKYIFIKKSGKYHSSRRYSFVGGVLSKSEREIRAEEDILKEANKEIKEEAGIENDNISSIELKAGYITENFNFCLVVWAEVDKDFDSVARNFDKMDKDEASVLFGINKKELADFSAKKLLAKDIPKLELFNLI
jgi:ADP-ribose pyrophosphatase YjhB (NUDIX family)